MLAVSLRRVASMTSAERDDRREQDEACFRMVQARIASGESRSDAFTSTGVALKVDRCDAIAGYWRYVRRVGRKKAGFP